MKKVLVVGNGAREHAICEVVKKSPLCDGLFVFGNAVNPGIKKIATLYQVGKTSDIDAILAFAKDCKPAFAIIGPEDPIARGLTDELIKIGIPSVAPLKALGQIESSKSFARNLLTKYGIVGNPEYKIFTDENGLKDYIYHLHDFVVKADGLKGGKGVKVSGDHFKDEEEGLLYAKECIKEDGRVVIEEKFVGQEFSLMSFCDGKHIADMPAVQDHKRAFVDDKGPNTGGMGTYSNFDHSLPFLNQDDLRQAHEITEKVMRALHQETGSYFKGILYGGFIATKNGTRLIEYNARFGDPEAMNVLSILKTDFILICEAILDGTLDEINVEFENKATVVKYVCPEGYPDNPVKDIKIEFGEPEANTKVYFASLDQREDGLYLLGSRAVACTGIANTLEEAESLAEKMAESVKGPVFFRWDIGTRALIDKRVAMMQTLRS